MSDGFHGLSDDHVVYSLYVAFASEALSMSGYTESGNRGRAMASSHSTTSK